MREQVVGTRRSTSIAGALGTALALALLLGAAPIQAQQGSIQGQVIDQNSLRPMASVQVFVQGLNLGGVTNAQGRFRIDGVPAGEVTVEAQLIGYAAQTATATVTAGGVAELIFELQSRVIDMDDIVVTGTGAPTQRRQLGQTINSVDASQLEQSPITSVADALMGRVPGIGGQAMGETGAATRITLRGVASLNTSLRNEPLIYVDGIRMDNRTYGVAGVAENRLGDINPADIDRIEVIKGAAAATLFGTEASSGVIQIFTKRGAPQAPVYTFSMDQQLIHLPHSKWPNQAGYQASTGEVVLQRPAETWVDLGHHQNYSLAVRGGSPGIQYSLSGRLMDEDGHMPNHFARNASVRSGFDFNHSETLTSSVNVSVTRNSLGASWPSWSSIGGDFLLANPANANEEFIHGESEMPIADRLSMKDESATTNVALSGSVVWTVRDDLVANFRVGHNDISRKRTRFAAEGDYFGRPGVRQIINTSTYATTLDANMNWQLELGRVSSTSTLGGQAFWEGARSEDATKSQFASPTLETLTGASTVNNLSESRQDVINAGFFVQQQFGLDNRFFLTAGLRMDGNSAFGEDFGLSTYPKVGFSWVVSDHAFFNVPGVDEFRVRGAIGTSGLQPGAFDAQRTWSPNVFAGGIPRVSPSNLGNPELQPERSTESELALEAGLFEGRLGFEAIYFQQQTRDALMSVSPPPSSGFSSTQLRNIGEMDSWGIELMSDLRLMDTPGFGWDVNAAYTYIDQKITTMGGIPDIRLSTRRRWGWLAEGYRPGVLIGPKQDPSEPYRLTVPVDQLSNLSQIVPNVLRDEDGGEALVVHGDALPSWTVDFGSTVRMGSALSFRALFTGSGGFLMSNETEVLRDGIQISPRVANIVAVLSNPNSTAAERQAAADDYGSKHPGVVPSYFEKGDFIKLNEVSVNYDLPDTFSGRIGLGRTSLMLGARNVHNFTGYSGILDPGAATGGVSLGGSIFESNIDYISAPTPRRYVFSIRTTR